MKHRFYKDDTGWYIDLPEFLTEGGDKADLQMVAGADRMLDILSKRGNEVTLTMLTGREFPTYEDDVILHLITEKGQAGADYEAVMENMNMPVWLCKITLYVFKHYPKTIYIKVVA